jgi:hypothetical protein
MDDSFFLKLSAEDEIKFRNWAREEYRANTPIKETWHPIVRDECKKINGEAKEVIINLDITH